MRILAVDSSALTASAAVLEDGIIKGEFSDGDEIYADISDSGNYTVRKMCADKLG